MLSEISQTQMNIMFFFTIHRNYIKSKEDMKYKEEYLVKRRELTIRGGKRDQLEG